MSKRKTVFVGIDCAYRSLGWSVVVFNPNCCAASSRDIFTFVDGGVVDTLGGKSIADVAVGDRARALHATFEMIFAVARDASAAGAAICVIIEKQPRGVGLAGAGVHDTNQTIEAQGIFYFSAIRGLRVYAISPKKKNKAACAILAEDAVKTYAARKMQSRRAFARLAEAYNFGARAAKVVGAVSARNTPDDLADSCLQIIAAVFLCARDIDKISPSGTQWD